MDAGKIIYRGHQDLLVETRMGSAITLTRGVPTLWLGPLPDTQAGRFALCIDAIAHLYNESANINAPFTIWNLPDEEFGQQPYESEEEFRAQLEGTAGAPISNELFTSYLLTMGIINAYTQVMDKPPVHPSDVKVVCAFFRQIVRVVDSEGLPWPAHAGHGETMYEAMENLLLSMASYNAVSRMPPPEMTGFIKRNYIPTIGALQAILIQVGEDYMITETIPPCDCYECRLMSIISNTERMVCEIGRVVESIAEALSDDDTDDDVRHPDAF